MNTFSGVFCSSNKNLDYCCGYHNHYSFSSSPVETDKTDRSGGHHNEVVDAGASGLHVTTVDGRNEFGSTGVRWIPQYTCFTALGNDTSTINIPQDRRQ